MAEKSYFFDSTEDKEAIYQAADFAKYHAQIIGNGVSNDPNLPNLNVQVTTGMVVRLGAGFMYANGYAHENTSARDLTVDAPSETLDRIDRVIIRFDDNPNERRTYAMILKGQAAVNPVAPSLTRTGYLYDMSVAQIRVKAGKSFIENSQITDERTNEEVCGYIPLHNIYRGLTVDEEGIVTMKNQSFVKAESLVQFKVPNTRTNMPFGAQGGIQVDTQGEVKGNDTFVVSTTGVYHIWAELGWWQDQLPLGVDVHMYLFVNGEESLPMAAKTFDVGNDNFLIGSGLDMFEAGDELTIKCIAYRYADQMPATRFVRARFAKVQ